MKHPLINKSEFDSSKSGMTENNFAYSEYHTENESNSGTYSSSYTKSEVNIRPIFP